MSFAFSALHAVDIYTQFHVMYMLLQNDENMAKHFSGYCTHLIPNIKIKIEHEKDEFPYVMGKDYSNLHR